MNRQALIQIMTKSFAGEIPDTLKGNEVQYEYAYRVEKCIFCDSGYRLNPYSNFVMITTGKHIGKIFYSYDTGTEFRIIKEKEGLF